MVFEGAYGLFRAITAMHVRGDELNLVRQANVMAYLRAALASLSIICKSTDSSFAAKRVFSLSGKNSLCLECNT